MRFDNKVVLVTGAASGIGRATAVGFSREGAKVALLSEHEPAETLAEIRNAGGQAIAMTADVSKSAQLEAAFDRLLAEYGRLDCAFNNAGIEGAKRPLAEQTEDVFDQVLAVNVKGVWLSMRRELQLFSRQGGGGAIVNAASIFSFAGYPTSSIYAASKGAVMALTRSTALEYACQNIRINAVCPGDIATPMTDKGLADYPGGRAAYEKSRVTGRMGKPEEIAGAVLYLCSDAASYVIGQSLVVDGGYLAQ